ncbi:MAG: PaaI family thioesterase [Clostridia bacterium]|nr:PaaI family thioesterase [Clostridia bacterium]
MIIEPKNKGIDQRLFEAMIKTNEECPYHNMLDMYITELNEGEAVLVMPISEKHLNPMAIVHGGATTSLMDTALGMAAKSLNNKVVTLEMNINFIKPVQFNETLTAKGKVVKAGRSIVVAEAEAYNDKGDKVAIGRGTFYVIDTFI